MRKREIASEVLLIGDDDHPLRAVTRGRRRDQWCAFVRSSSQDCHIPRGKPCRVSPLATRFGKYELIATLGQGGMADVYLAIARGLGQFHKLVVIKRLRDELAGRESYRTMLLDEARLAARLSHPNVVMTLEVGEEAGHVFLAMEYLDGQPLHRISSEATRRDQPLDLALSLRIVVDVLAGLRHAHTLADYDGVPLRIVHRDVSPQNIFVTYAGEVKLVDFGIAKVASATDEQTEVGTLKGKLSYMAPEQARADEVDARADLYCAGIVLFELVSRRRLFAGEAAEKLRKVADGIVPRLAEVVPGVDPELDSLVARALAPAKPERFQSAEDMRAALEGYMDRRGLRARSDDLGQKVSALFAAEHAEMQRRIKDRVSAVETRGAGGALPLTPLVPADATGSVRTESDPARSAAPPSAASRGRRGVSYLVLSMVGLGLVGGGTVAWVFLSGAGAKPETSKTAPSAPSTAVASAAAEAPREETLLRLRGSNTVGAELAPALVTAFLKQKGASNVRRAPGKVVAAFQGKDAPQIVVIDAEGTATAFKGLVAGECDIGMASRPIHDDEAKAADVAGLGDLRAPASEHVLGLDGIAVIVHRNSPLRVLDTEALGAIFAGETKDWSKVIPEKNGPIAVYARDDNSGTFDTFKNLVLGSHKLTEGAKRFAESDRLSDEVASDVSGIGFIGLAYVRSAKAVAVSDHAAPPMLPSPFTVTTEGYPLSRRLYLYTPGPRTTRTALDFVNFALSSEGQRVVRDAGFVDLNVGLSEAEKCDARCPPGYAELVKRGRRLSLDFRFRFGTDNLDSRGTRDLDRLVLFLRDHAGSRLMLFGFSDGTGDKVSNAWLSKERAKKIAAELEERGVHPTVVEGFGAAMPVASNADEAGRARNRRVEAWVEGER